VARDFGGEQKPQGGWIMFVILMLAMTASRNANCSSSTGQAVRTAPPRAPVARSETGKPPAPPRPAPHLDPSAPEGWVVLRRTRR
jgi:hypothetical protein